MKTSMDIPHDQSLIEYPSRFPIKVMGANVESFAQVIADLALIISTHTS